jgi:hypothetical protein
LAEVCKKSSIDALAILEWMVGEGRDIVEKEFWTPLIARFKETRRFEIVDKMTIRVNLDAPPRLPFEGAVVHNKPKGKGWVEVKRKGNELFVDGKKVILPLSEKQKGDKTVVGTELLKELEKKPVLHPNIMDALCEHPHLIPDSWKQNEEKETLYIFFWDVVLRDSDGNLYVRYFFWFVGAWFRSYRRLGCDFSRQDPAAQLAS